MSNVVVLHQKTTIALLGLLFALGCGGGSTGSDADGNNNGTGAESGSDSDAGETGTGGRSSGGIGSGAAGPGGTGSGGTSVGGTSSTAGTASGGTTADLGVCSNGMDDDGDGFVDGFDPECTGALDNDEGTFATGIPGDNRDPKWQDCFFDGNSGAGDDGCRYATGCLTGELEQDDEDCQLTDACVKFCKPLTPNGCDCFGCCTLQDSDGETADVLISASCSIDKLADETACPRCEKSAECGNTCGRCELCPGKTELPDDCTPPPTGGSGGQTGSGGNPGSGGSGGSVEPPPSHTCDNGEQVCSQSIPCAGSYYCQLGCCLPIVR